MIILRHQILQRFQIVSASLQSADQYLNSACALYESLRGYVGSLRPNFTDMEDYATILNDCNQCHKDMRVQSKKIANMI